jgi:hypothetical protein
MLRATGRAVCGFFAQPLERHGVPEEILTVVLTEPIPPLTRVLTISSKGNPQIN